MSKQVRVLSVIVASIFFLQAGCASPDDPEKRKKRALAGGATSTALGIATGVGGPLLLARAGLGAASRVATGEAMDKIEEEDKEEEKGVKKEEDQKESEQLHDSS